MENKVQFSGGKWCVWETYAFTYEGPDWYTPLRRKVGEFDTKDEADQALAGLN
jgi:hypothetical protein